MMTIILRTAGGADVATHSIPQFTTLPQVILWGNRVFSLVDIETREYREVFFWVIPG